MATAACWDCAAQNKNVLSPTDINTIAAIPPSGQLDMGWSVPALKYHATEAYSERGIYSINLRPRAGHSFGTLELGGRFYIAEMISVHAIGLHTIDGVRYDGEIQIHHYMYGDWWEKGGHNDHDAHEAAHHDDHGAMPGGDHGSHSGGDHGGGDHGGDHGAGHRRLDTFRGNTHTSENVAGAPSYQVVVSIPLKVTTNPGGDFMDMLLPHSLETGSKAYLSHSDLANIFASDFYQYRGNPIYPVCSTDVEHWIVYKQPLLVSASQLFTEFPTRSGFDTAPHLRPNTGYVFHKNFVPVTSQGSTEDCSAIVEGNWTYSDTHCWQNNYPDCGGQMQSPINIIDESADVVRKGAHEKDIFLNFVKYHPVTKLFLTYNGHAIQASDKMNGITHMGLGYFTALGHYYFLRQFHLHCPSEHVINGRQHACELHLVHQRQDHWGETAFENSDLLVAGIFFDIGDQESPLLRQMFLPEINHEHHVNSHWNRSVESPIDLMRALGPILQGDYYRYHGSLTTPPCSEVVKWFVFKNSLSMSQEQFDSFKMITGLDNPANARPVQKLYGRRIELNSFDAPGEDYVPVEWEFYLDRIHGRNREEPNPLIILGGVVGGIILGIVIMGATFVRQDPKNVKESAGGLVTAATRYGRMTDRM